MASIFFFDGAAKGIVFEIRCLALRALRSPCGSAEPERSVNLFCWTAREGASESRWAVYSDGGLIVRRVQKHRRNPQMDLRASVEGAQMPF